MNNSILDRVKDVVAKEKIKRKIYLMLLITLLITSLVLIVLSFTVFHRSQMIFILSFLIILVLGLFFLTRNKSYREVIKPLMIQLMAKNEYQEINFIEKEIRMDFIDSKLLVTSGEKKEKVAFAGEYKKTRFSTAEYYFLNGEKEMKGRIVEYFLTNEIPSQKILIASSEKILKEGYTHEMKHLRLDGEGFKRDIEVFSNSQEDLYKYFSLTSLTKIHDYLEIKGGEIILSLQLKSLVVLLYDHYDSKYQANVDSEEELKKSLLHVYNDITIVSDIFDLLKISSWEQI